MRWSVLPFVLAVAAGCSSPPERASLEGVKLDYTATRVKDADSKEQVYVEVRFLDAGRTIQAPSLWMLPGQWATIFVGDTEGVGVDAASAPRDGDAWPRPVQRTVGGFAARIRCDAADEE